MNLIAGWDSLVPERYPMLKTWDILKIYDLEISCDYRILSDEKVN